MHDQPLNGQQSQLSASDRKEQITTVSLELFKYSI